MAKNSVEIRSAIDEAKNRAKEIIDLAKTEVRELTEDEQKEINELKDTIEEKKRELKELEEELKSYDNLIEDDEDEPKEEKNNKRNKMKKNNTSFISELRNAMKENRKSFRFNAATETRAVTVNGDGVNEGIHNETVETEIQGILEPLYANSVLTQLGVRWYTGYPMGDIQVPIMGKGSVGWKGEIAQADSANYAFTSKKLSPKRLTVQIPISKQVLAQDNIGVEQAIRADIVRALYDELQATILGTQAKTDDKPGGIFYNVTPDTVTSYKELCEFESELDDENINGSRKYLLGNGAKAAFRSMIKGTNATGMVLERGDIDGTPAYDTSNLAGGKLGKYNFVYGDWSYLAIASWGDLDVTYDEYTLAAEGQIRLVINSYFDALILKDEAFKFGTVDEGESGNQGSQGSQG